MPRSKFIVVGATRGFRGTDKHNGLIEVIESEVKDLPIEIVRRDNLSGIEEEITPYAMVVFFSIDFDSAAERLNSRYPAVRIVIVTGSLNSGDTYTTKGGIKHISPLDLRTATLAELAGFTAD